VAVDKTRLAGARSALLSRFSTGMGICDEGPRGARSSANVPPDFHSETAIVGKCRTKDGVPELDHAFPHCPPRAPASPRALAGCGIRIKNRRGLPSAVFAQSGMRASREVRGDTPCLHTTRRESAITVRDLSYCCTPPLLHLLSWVDQGVSCWTLARTLFLQLQSGCATQPSLPGFAALEKSFLV
jgi:hypothetical protein